MKNDQIISSSKEFDFATSDDEFTWISGGLCHQTNESTDAVRGVRWRKIRIIESDSEVESDVESESEEVILQRLRRSAAKRTIYTWLKHHSTKNNVQSIRTNRFFKTVFH